MNAETKTTIAGIQKIERIILDMQYFQNGMVQTFKKVDNNREAFEKIVCNLFCLDILDADEVLHIMSLSPLIPMERRREHDIYDNMFHAKRITDIISGIITPSNYYNDGVTDFGRLEFDFHSRRQTIFSSLYECGILSSDVYRCIISQIK